MYDPERPVTLKTDASDYVLEIQIKYRDNDSKLYPIIFYFYKLIGTELNYFIYDKEFLIIINVFKKFRYYFIKNIYQIKVYINYKNILYFLIT